MEVVPKNYPTITKSDSIYPVVIWQDRPELIHIAFYDHRRRRRLSLRGAQNLNTQILYEDVDFVTEKGGPFSLNRLYRGIAVFRRNDLKTLKTSRHIIHRM